MAHNLEMVNGQASFVSLREPAWHKLGTVVTEEMTTSEVMDYAHLSNWNVRLEDVIIPDDYTATKNAFMVVRDHPADKHGDVLAIVGERYKVVQNEEIFTFADNLLDGARWETAGAIKNGRVVFGTLALERETVLDPTGVADVVKNYLFASTSHDGSSAVNMAITPTRVVCQNTFQIAMRNAKASYKLRHTQSVDGRIVAAREALGLAHKFIDEFEVMAQELIQKEITKSQFDKMIALAYPMPDKDTKGAMKKWENKSDLLEEIYTSDTTNMIAGTAWGAYNALTERLDWHRAARGGNTEAMFAAASGFDPMLNAEKSKLLSIVREVVGL